MSALTEIRSALSVFGDFAKTEDGYAVATQHVYPSGSFVTAYIQSAMSESVIVTDGGGAVDCLSSHGLVIENLKRAFPPSLVTRGLKMTNGILLTQPIPVAALPSAIPLLSRASVSIAEHGLKVFRPKRRRDLEQEIFNTLSIFIGRDRILREKRLVGASNRPYTFDFVAPIGDDKQLVVDAVSPEANSMNAKVVSHIDVARAMGDSIQHRLVYDDEDAWDSSDLALLQMAAVTVPLSGLRSEMSRMSSIH
ncbi:hypothetical protein FRZ44_14160 [Hypericibacter terrae]|uniref:DUF1828 domain-containing protein n=1 Tax=Hypericibacter terrae TaxID=2602015 RepID=A0A5J6MF57_9PROT|nr:hypothetical protein [Hypericibacter terrae]QEX16124.1 hypothetical protein FRZ44_14160 [Hypericibacter terrae]